VDNKQVQEQSLQTKIHAVFLRQKPFEYLPPVFKSLSVSFMLDLTL